MGRSVADLRASGEDAGRAVEDVLEDHSLTLAVTKTVAISLLLPADSPRSGGESAEHVRMLAESDAELPPIVVHRPTMRVIDGMHRLRAAALRGDTGIEARLYDGTPEDAFVFAVRLNTSHGLPLSAQERSRAAARIMTTHPQWSDRRIALVAGLSAKTVGAIRRRRAGELPQPLTRIGHDGRARPVNGAAGRRRAAEVLAEKPGASLREVAELAGVSPGTVRDVRDRLRRGDDPVPTGRRTGGGGRTAGAPPGWGGDAPGSTVRRDVPRRTLQRDYESILRTLRKDPSLRFTEAGRNVLRLLDTRALFVEEQEGLISGLPGHCMPMLSDAARECANAWIEFAKRLDRLERAQYPQARTRAALREPGAAFEERPVAG
ncbi:ParB N-terminal domain-containing protein [Streptomyces olivoreticuli]|uniref:ParB/RepB/Spo0J family partition protein n=1 Tax=Streptomyces olivoreticuli TaxID=68246 RepID=UPI002658ECA3|nr:ParB N-terminal domain-containing protein [Streptomyces olivoreticuli]WKK25788.1 ParB N-terminal domain-containing protein [Streptomyces olivoreticuli]